MQNKYNFKAVIFDLDGVITKTAATHATAWKNMFDEYLKQRATTLGEEFQEFHFTKDYLPYVDGKPRYNGVKSFLESRNIQLEYGDPEDGIEKETICGLGNRKNKSFNEVLQRDGVERFESTVELMHQLKDNGIRIGVASSSKNCRTVLKAANLMHMVETIVDGTDSVKLGLNGKPAPDIFTTAADNLGVSYHKAVVVEDASSGVAAGKAGNFGFVLGLARENNTQELYKNGADIVVDDIDDIKIEGIEEWFQEGLEADNWSVSYRDYDADKEKSRESLLSMGNGYFGNRGAMEEIQADEKHYPATYMAGLYNRLKSPIGDRMIENEDFVNTPNWTLIQFKIGDGEWWDYKTAQFDFYKKTLCLKTGILSKEFLVSTTDGKQFKITSKRMISMTNMHAGAQQYEFTPLNFSDDLHFKIGMDGEIQNRGVNRYNTLNQNHLEFISADHNSNKLNLTVQTSQSHMAVSQSIRHTANVVNQENGVRFSATTENHGSYAYYETYLKKNQTFKIEKVLSIFKDEDAELAKTKSIHHLETLASFDILAKESESSWNELWAKIDIQVEGDRLSQKLLRLHSYHMMVSASNFNTEIDASVTARGLHGEAYRGHIFWDELFILPFYNSHYPQISKSLLMYRYRRLDEARKYAKQHGYKGAMFPWQSGSDGREETQTVHLNPLTGHWGEDNSSLQRHVSLAIAYNIYQYVKSTNDWTFIEEYGAEMYLDICRFWVSKAQKNPETGKYSIDKVMGPDEFHEMSKDAKEGGLKDNAYTNIMVAWMLGKVNELTSKMDCVAEENVMLKLQIPYQEILQWESIAKNLNLSISKEGILEQYDGYFQLKELDWDAYRKKYGNIYRMDRLLKSEGKSADDYKVAKQADTLMTFFNLEKKEVDALLNKMGYDLPADYLKKNLTYYLARTSHGSSLSRVVHAQLANMLQQEELSWDLFQDALGSDYVDVQGGTTGEGIHTGVMASTLVVAISNYAGVNTHKEVLEINPQLPKHWESMRFNMLHRGIRYHFVIAKNKLEVKSDSAAVLLINEKEVSLEANSTFTTEL
ncbi:MAG: beta-phosphoglucomutase [Bacteroidetes bacterium 4572_77]|nr:MAG: beta-phosphoglucomutase [Bacteroidetes bacterium 4572_77]